MRACTVILLVAAVTAEVIDIVPCGTDVGSKCAINEIRVDPCSSSIYKKYKYCQLKKGTDATISFDFTPNFSANTLTTEVLYGITPFNSVETDACKSTTCPIQESKKQTYSTSLHIGKKLPTGTFEFEWQVFDASNASNKCCFKMTVRLRK